MAAPRGQAIEAARLLQPRRAAPRSSTISMNGGVERRLVARKLLDIGEQQAAYVVARDALPPTKDNPRAEHEFTAGWIALRFTNNPQAAYQHFARVGHDTSNPITIARRRVLARARAGGDGPQQRARRHYEAAAQHSTAYYGQIARARLGFGELPLRRPPEPTNRASLMRLEVVRAVQLLYAADARDLIVPFVSDLAENALDIGALVVVAEVARKYDDARAMLLIGKGALRRGFALEAYAFPDQRNPGLPHGGPRGRQERGLRDRPPGERVQSAKRSRTPMRSA
jgi:soluble lytic murein transglycosylase